MTQPSPVLVGVNNGIHAYAIDRVVFECLSYEQAQVMAAILASQALMEREDEDDFKTPEQLRAEIEELEEEIETLNQTLEELKEDRSSVQSEIDLAGDELEETTSAVESLRREEKELIDRLASLRSLIFRRRALRRAVRRPTKPTGGPA